MDSVLPAPRPPAEPVAPLRMLWRRTITDWTADRDAVMRGRYGVIEAVAGRVVAVHLRPWPKLLSWPEIWLTSANYHARGAADRCLLYYNQPRRHANYLALRYMESTRATSYATARAALVGLDALAELKGADALLCEAANTRISDRLMARFGWAPHTPARWRRNFIKRFYGAYPGMLATLCSEPSGSLPLRRIMQGHASQPQSGDSQ